ncbi:MAG: nicotinamide-nucleotide amidohydrolase family protein, partial [Oscillospiraceae bacterium]|nr:nicotinamide-nucleotide amidohydrolase family protein [Oscillospiraceae bacterium]
MTPVLTKVQDALGDIIYGVDTVSLENTVFHLLKRMGMTFAAAESCTGGLISKRITDIPGASSVFMGSTIAYSEHTKSAVLDIPSELVEQKNAVSPEVSLAMADSVRIKFSASIGIGITGIAGPDSDSSGQKPGTVFVALTTKDIKCCRHLSLYSDRERIRTGAANHAFDMIRRLLTGLPLD